MGQGKEEKKGSVLGNVVVVGVSVVLGYVVLELGLGGVFKFGCEVIQYLLELQEEVQVYEQVLKLVQEVDDDVKVYENEMYMFMVQE